MLVRPESKVMHYIHKKVCPAAGAPLIHDLRDVDPNNVRRLIILHRGFALGRSKERDASPHESNKAIEDPEGDTGPQERIVDLVREDPGMVKECYQSD